MKIRLLWISTAAFFRGRISPLDEKGKKGIFLGNFR